jgi:hypothetical protein
MSRDAVTAVATEAWRPIRRAPGAASADAVGVNLSVHTRPAGSSALHRGEGDALFQSQKEQRKPERDGGYANSQ